MMTHTSYIGRFAPSPTGPLHAGSVVAALASWLDARAYDGKWLVRIEDVDTPRTVPGAAEQILQQLAALGLHSDEPVQWQSQRSAHYEAALEALAQKRLTYPCVCSRKDIERAIKRTSERAYAEQGLTRARNTELRYPGTCRHIENMPISIYTHYCTRVFADINPDVLAIANESIISSHILKWHDRRLGAQQQNVQDVVGDFVLKRADGCYTYQLAVVVDDALQGITHVVRGEDLADNTARQMLLQQHLGYSTPQYLHTPLVLAADGQKLSKQNGAVAVEVMRPELATQAVQDALKVLHITSSATKNLSECLREAVAQWRFKN